MKNLVIGLGEVGSAVRAILDCDGLDPFIKRDDTRTNAQYNFIHICFPYSEDFVEKVQAYQELFKAKVVIHSTVPLGTCDPHGWTHSPIRGVHPNLEEGIRTFVKYVGGIEAHAVAEELQAHGIKCIETERAKNTEALKLLDTTQYGMMIMLEKQIYDWCQENNVDYILAYQEANQTYNEGYRFLGKPEVVRPYLKHVSGPIGGHCVIPNAHLIKAPFAETLINFNEQLK